MTAETEIAEKVLEARVTVSSDSRTAHIGRYFIDFRDVTNGAEHQVTTRVTSDPAAVVAQFTAAGIAAGVLVVLVDNTGE